MKAITYETLSKAYKQFLEEEPVSPSFDGVFTNEHNRNIRHFQLQAQQLKDKFIGLFAHLKYSIQSKMRELHRYVHEPRLGGTIEIISSDYYKYEQEQIEICKKLEQFYIFIMDYDRYIQEEYTLIELEKDKKLLEEYRLNEWRKQPIYVERYATQLTINFDVEACRN